MSRKIIGATVGTPLKPEKVIERTEIDEAIENLQEDVSQLSKDVADLKENGTGNIGTDFGGVEITDGEPTKETTVMTLNPNAEEVHLYTVPEIDEMLQNLPSGEGGANLDVQINGTSIVENGVANIPLATQSTFGVSKPYGANYGIKTLGAGILVLAQATKDHINGRQNFYAPITSSNLDYAVRTAMCDGVGEEWTEEEKASAMERLGVPRKTLLGEVVATGHRKIQPLAIDFDTGIVTVDDCSFLPSDKVAYTKFRLCVRKKSDAFYPNNVIPQELYGGIGVQKISDNTLYLYQGSTKIESFTESATIDLNAWYLEYSEVATSHITVDLTGMEFGNHLQVELFNPNAEVQSIVVMTTVVRDNENNQYLEHNQTDGIRPVNGDVYSFDSVRSIPSGSANANKVKGNAMPIRYIYDFKVDDDFIYVTGKNIFAVADNKDKLPVYYTEEKSILLQNKGLTKFGMSLGTQYLMIPEGSYVKVWEVHD